MNTRHESSLQLESEWNVATRNPEFTHKLSRCAACSTNLSRTMNRSALSDLVAANQSPPILIEAKHSRINISLKN